MFVEKLQPEEVIDFLKNELKDEDLKLIHIKEYGKAYCDVGEWTVELTLPNDEIRSVTMNAFNVATNLEGVHMHHIRTHWKFFMYQKFGKEYKHAYNRNLKSEYKIEMIK